MGCNGRTMQQSRKEKDMSQIHVLLHTQSSDTTICSTECFTTQCRTCGLLRRADTRSEHLKSLQIHPPNSCRQEDKHIVSLRNCFMQLTDPFTIWLRICLHCPLLSPGIKTGSAAFYPPIFTKDKIEISFIHKR